MTLVFNWYGLQLMFAGDKQVLKGPAAKKASAERRQLHGRLSRRAGDVRVCFGV
jgi:hypothetical protein